jgi:hypothetical protein
MENQMRPHGRRKAARRPFGAMVIHVKRVVNDIDLRNRKKKKTEWGGVMDIRRIEILSLCRWGFFRRVWLEGISRFKISLALTGHDTRTRYSQYSPQEP